MSWKWNDGGGHAVVIYGYSNSGTYVNYMDPADGSKTAMKYASFVGGDDYDRTWRWGLPKKLKAADDNKKIKSITRSAEEWDFVILLDGKPKSFLTIGKEGSEYTVISVGGSAEDFGEAYDKLISSVGNKDKPVLVKSKGVRILVGEKNDSEFIIPGISEQKSALLSGISNKSATPSKELISSLKEMQSADNQDHDSGGIVTKQTYTGLFTWTNIISSLVIAALAVIIVIKLKSGKNTLN